MGLEGTIPPQVSNLSFLASLDLSDNYFHASLPNEIGDIPEEMSNLLSLKILSLFVNNLTGSIPKGIGNLSELEVLYLGEIPEALFNISSLRIFDLPSNNLSGIGNLSKLDELYLSINNLTGELPQALYNISSLRAGGIQSISLADNHLSGNLPSSIGAWLPNLLQFHKGGNEFSGVIPRSISNISKLTSLDLSYNFFTGYVPKDLGNLRSLQHLAFGSNYLTDKHSTSELSFLPSLTKCKSLRRLWIQDNPLKVPSCYGNLTALQQLFRDSNTLASQLPSSLWSLGGILYLNLSSNFLNALGQLQNLVELSLSKINMQGPIPLKFGDLVSLESLDLSWNNLSGEIPNGGPFLNFTAKSFTPMKHYVEHQGFQVMACKKVTTRKSTKAKSLLLKCVLPTIASTIIILALIILLIRRQKRLDIPIQVDSSLPTTYRKISHQELLHATNYFSEGNLIGKGSMGTVYKGVLFDGLTAAIKVFSLEFLGSFKGFEAECEVMRNICHRNLIKIISSCSNLDFKALVLEFMPNGSLERWLYSHNYCLDLIQRLNITIDVASALEYLHHDYSNPVVHCDLKPNNVLLDEDMVAHVGDFGIAKLLPGSESRQQTKTLGQLAIWHQYGSEGIVSTSDVYSYGIMLLEVFARKKPTDEMFIGDLTLKSWVESLASTVMEFVDTNLLDKEDEHFAIKENCVLCIMALALECTAESPEERINMRDVVARLKKIRIKLLM
ncbi:putative LRR receptor-like serine/threonine-protein kinase [Vitis vinifera]|uniref:non-specific serine/threonine protein kinase n=1 Tax=Vitis vinifera TaxID=29760 RepID=A0A438CHT8_VITVI|nr:putative LRR receptor-like serine/threonine-protein kinase [Vitis vinifera]